MVNIKRKCSRCPNALPGKNNKIQAKLKVMPLIIFVLPLNMAVNNAREQTIEITIRDKTYRRNT